MSRQPVCRGTEAVAALRRAGFVVDRQSGSHTVLHKPGHPNPVVVPIHSRTLKTGTLRHIIKAAGLTVEEFRRLL